MAHEASWERWRGFYRGQWPRNTLPVNIFFRMLRTVVPRIYFRDPSISCIATKPGLEQQLFAQLIERIDNKLIRTMGVKREMKKMIHNTWMFGTSAGKLGYGAQFTPTPDEFDTEAPSHTTSKLTRKVEYHAGITANMPWFMSVHPGQLVVPKGLASFNDTPWVGTWIKRALDDIQSDPRFSNVKDLKSSTYGGSQLIPSKPALDMPDQVDLCEIRDMRTGKVLVLAPYCTNRILYCEDDDLQNNGRPNVYPLVFNPDDEVFWGVPDSVILEPQQLEMNEIRTLMMKHRRLSLIKILYKDKAIDPTELEKMLNGDVGAAIRIQGELSDIDNFQVADIPQSLLAAGEIIENDVRENMGFSRNQAGNFASQKSHNAPTAYETSVVQAASEIRVDERKDEVADVLVQLFEDTNALIFNQWTDEQVVQVMGPDAVPYWVAFKPAMLKAARYEMNIDPDSTTPQTREVRREIATMVYTTGKANPLIDPEMLTKYWLREMGGVSLDDMMRQVQSNAAAGAPGSSPDQPMGPEQFMQQMMQPPSG